MTINNFAVNSLSSRCYVARPPLQGNLEGCVSKQLGEEAGAVLARETLKADPEALAKLMADHTRVHAAVTEDHHTLDTHDCTVTAR